MGGELKDLWSIHRIKESNSRLQGGGTDGHVNNAPVNFVHSPLGRAMYALYKFQWQLPWLQRKWKKYLVLVHSWISIKKAPHNRNLLSFFELCRIMSSFFELCRTHRAFSNFVELIELSRILSIFVKSGCGLGGFKSGKLNATRKCFQKIPEWKVTECVTYTLFEVQWRSWCVTGIMKVTLWRITLWPHSQTWQLKGPLHDKWTFIEDIKNKLNPWVSKKLTFQRMKMALASEYILSSHIHNVLSP